MAKFFDWVCESCYFENTGRWYPKRFHPGILECRMACIQCREVWIHRTFAADVKRHTGDTEGY